MFDHQILGLADQIMATRDIESFLHLKFSWLKGWIFSLKKADMEIVKNFTHPDFQAKSFTPQKCVICDSFFRELTA